MAARARKIGISSLISHDPEFEAYAAAQRRDERHMAKLAACAGRRDYTMDEVIEMIDGKRKIPYSVGMSIETALAIGRRGAMRVAA